MTIKMDAGHKVEGPYNNCERTEKAREVCGIFTNNKKQMKTLEKHREARTMKSRLARKWNSNNNGDYEDNGVIDGLRTRIRQKL
jgi:hypothetical protein